MASYHEIPRPERPKGTDEERWQQVYRYLYQLAEHLEINHNVVVDFYSEVIFESIHYQLCSAVGKGGVKLSAVFFRRDIYVAVTKERGKL